MISFWSRMGMGLRLKRMGLRHLPKKADFLRIQWHLFGFEEIKLSEKKSETISLCSAQAYTEYYNHFLFRLTRQSNHRQHCCHLLALHLMLMANDVKLYVHEINFLHVAIKSAAIFPFFGFLTWPFSFSVSFYRLCWLRLLLLWLSHTLSALRSVCVCVCVLAFWIAVLNLIKSGFFIVCSYKIERVQRTRERRHVQLLHPIVVHIYDTNTLTQCVSLKKLIVQIFSWYSSWVCRRRIPLQFDLKLSKSERFSPTTSASAHTHTLHSNRKTESISLQTCLLHSTIQPILSLCVFCAPMKFMRTCT